MRRAFLFGGILLSLYAARHIAAQVQGSGYFDRVYVGILDDDRQEVANWEPGPARHRLVRITFERTGKGWIAVPPDSASVPQAMNWTVAFDGRRLGAIQTEDPKLPTGGTDRESNYNARIQRIVTPAERIPNVGKPAARFAPMGEWQGPSKARRPLVVVSRPNFSDPDGWKRMASPPPEISVLVLQFFRQEFPHVSRCKDEKVVKHDWQFPNTALSFPATYNSNKGSFLVEADLNAGDCGYIDDQNDPESNPWFFVSADRKIRRIGSFLMLLDAGDYDNDGRSELIFILNQPEDTDGFWLFDADLKKRAAVEWTYH